MARLRAAAEMRALIAALSLISCTAVCVEQPDPAAARFSGNASLRAPIAESLDQRFVINAKLQANRIQGSGRFALDSRLIPKVTDGAATCGPRGGEIFRNGFEAS